MKNNLSIEAKVIAGSFWGLIHHSQVSFGKPNQIHPTARKALTELVDAGYLNETARNHIKDCPVDFTATSKMKDLPHPDYEWLKQNSTFPMTIQGEE